MSAIADSSTEAVVTSPVRSLTGKLGTTSIVFMVVAAAAPLTVLGGAAPLGMLLGNGVGFPALFAISGVILLLFAVGLTAMTRVVPRPGAFFFVLVSPLKSHGPGAAGTMQPPLHESRGPTSNGL